jgi:hypothetical protein
MDKGYDIAVIDDEIQAYLATSTKGYIKNRFEEPLSSMRIPSDFRKFFQQFDKGWGGK